MIIKIDVAKLTKLFFKKIISCFDMSVDIVTDKNFLFINVFWSAFCYHAKIKRRLSTVFHSLNERANAKTKSNIKTLSSKLRWLEADKMNKFIIIDRVWV